MPRARTNGIEIYYEEHGAGQPLLLIGGLGANVLDWAPQIPVLARHYRVVAFDNRGAGRSDKPDALYSIPQFADDTAGLMDALGIAAAHVLGHSMGGFIAQELALRYPQRLKSLVLSATTCGGTRSVPPPQESMHLLTNLPTMTLREAAEHGLPLLYSRQFIDQSRDIIIRNTLQSAQYPCPPHAHRRQFWACLSYTSYDRLPDIKTPTLVIAGSDDQIIPCENSRILARRIPNAELLILDGVGHGYLLETQEKALGAILDFLRHNS